MSTRITNRANSATAVLRNGHVAERVDFPRPTKRPPRRSRSSGARESWRRRLRNTLYYLCTYTVMCIQYKTHGRVDARDGSAAQMALWLMTVTSLPSAATPSRASEVERSCARDSAAFSFFPIILRGIFFKDGIVCTRTLCVVDRILMTRAVWGVHFYIDFTYAPRSI